MRVPKMVSCSGRVCAPWLIVFLSARITSKTRDPSCDRPKVCEWQEDEGTGAKAGSGEADVEETEVMAATSPKGSARGAALAACADGEKRRII